MNTKTVTLLLSLFLSGNTLLRAQNDYLVSTSSQQSQAASEEDQFLIENFPLQILCQWEPGIKFMFMPTAKEQFVPIFSSFSTEKEVDTPSLKYKVFEFLGTEEKSYKISAGTNYNTRFVFQCEGEKYYYEVKNQRLGEICEKNPRISIPGLVYLKDVDTAKELLTGKVVYVQATTVRVDDANSYSGFREVGTPANMRATITAVGVGSKAFPVKVVFENDEGKAYYLEVALSRTNSGMDIKDFQADKRMKLFTNAFSFTNKNLNTLEALKAKYVGLPIYPKQTIEAKNVINIEGKPTDNRVHLFKYTPLYIKDVQVQEPTTLATLLVTDKQGKIYNLEVDLKYNFIIKNNNYIEDLFGIGDIHKKYPHITEENWKLIAQGEVKPGMTTDECRLALGSPIEVQLKKDNRFETWFYNGKILEFESGTLLRYK